MKLDDKLRWSSKVKRPKLMLTPALLHNAAVPTCRPAFLSQIAANCFKLKASTTFATAIFGQP